MALIKLNTQSLGSTKINGDNLPVGSIIQTKHTTLITQSQSTSRDAWTDLSGMSVSITAKGTDSHFFVRGVIHQAGYISNYYWSPHLRILRGTTVAGTVGTDTSNNRKQCHTPGHSVAGYNDGSHEHTVETLDKPTSTAIGTSYTYKIQFYLGGGTTTAGFLRGRVVNDDDISGGNGCMTLTVQEIAT